MKVKLLVAKSCLTLRPHGLWPTRFLCQWNSPCKNTGVGSHSLLQGRRGISKGEGEDPGDLPDLGIELGSLALAGGFFTTEPPGKSIYVWLQSLRWQRVRHDLITKQEKQQYSLYVYDIATHTYSLNFLNHQTTYCQPSWFLDTHMVLISLVWLRSSESSKDINIPITCKAEFWQRASTTAIVNPPGAWSRPHLTFIPCDYLSYSQMPKSYKQYWKELFSGYHWRAA